MVEWFVFSERRLVIVTALQGFFLHWEMIDGTTEACDAFPFTQDLAIRGHNTES